MGKGIREDGKEEQRKRTGGAGKEMGRRREKQGSLVPAVSRGKGREGEVGT